MLTATVPSQEAKRSIEEAAGSSKYRHKKEDSSDLIMLFLDGLLLHNTPDVPFHIPNFRLTDEWPIP